MKKHYLLLSFLSIYTFGQTGKVGVNTDNPTENLMINGTVRAVELPVSGTTNSIYTINSETTNNGTSSATKNQTFSAVNTVVVDKNGVMGVVTGLPITVAPTVKSIQYVTKSTPINSSTPANSVVSLGNIEVRFDGTNPTGGEQTWSFRLINNITSQNGNPATADNVVANNIKVGSGGLFGGQHQQIPANKETWYAVTNGSGRPNVSNRDFVQSNITLVNTKEVYRLTISVTPNVTNGILSTGQVTMFLERLTDQ